MVLANGKGLAWGLSKLRFAIVGPAQSIRVRSRRCASEVQLKIMIFFCRRPLPIDSTRLCWGRTDHRYPGRLPAVYSCTLGGSPSCTLGGSPACAAALQTRPSDTPLVSGARAEPSGAERSRAERGTPSLNGLSAELNLEPCYFCRAKGPPGLHTVDSGHAKLTQHHNPGPRRIRTLALQK